MSSSTDTEFVLVKRKDLERLTTEVMQMRDFLPQILNQELVESVQRLEAAEIALETKELDCAHVSARLEVSQGEYLRANEENQALLVQVTSLQEQSVQQAEYCTHMGSALCSLLWGLSTNEGIVNSILGMDKAPEFFNLASHTVVSFVESLAGEQPQDDDTEESRFVLGLAGTITNVAAVSCGREFLMSSCRDLMESWFHLLGKISLGTCNRLRVLILMSLYNVSINRNGVLWMSQCVGFISQLQRLLTDPDPEICLNVLHLIQSVIMDTDILRLLWKDIQECVPRVMELSQSGSPDLQRLARELLEEVRGRQDEI